MGNIDNEKINIFGLQIDKIDFGLLLSKIYITITQKTSISIAYANANTLNNIYTNSEIKDKLNSFDIVHPDGIGIFIASRFIFGKNGFRQRMTGSDFYPILINEAIKRNWSIYFFGHDTCTLNKIKETNTNLNVAGFTQGFNYQTGKVIDDINNSRAEILVVGLGFPMQEEWIYSNRNNIMCNVIIAVGDGIRVFTGNKIRGPVFVRRIGLEWLVRFFTNPVKYWKRYIIGNPLFLYRIIKLKLSKFKKL